MYTEATAAAVVVKLTTVWNSEDTAAAAVVKKDYSMVLFTEDTAAAVVVKMTIVFRRYSSCSCGKNDYCIQKMQKLQLW